MKDSNRKINLFISYSHLDESEKEQFVKFLNAVDSVNFDIWVDDRIEAGAEFAPVIAAAIEKADIAILLVSPDFLNSKFIKTKELPRILEKQSDQVLKVFPVIIKSSSWPNVEWIAKRNVKPKNGKPVFEQDNINRALQKITDEIVLVAKDILEKEEVDSNRQSLNQTNEIPSESSNLDNNLSKSIILPFSNRVDILARLDPHNIEKEIVFQNFIAIDGPAGRGKTELIGEISERYKDAGWDCALGVIRAPKGETEEDIQQSRISNRQIFVSQLATSLKIENWVPRSAEFGKLGGQLFVEYENLKSKSSSSSTGLSFFIDWDGEVDQSELKAITESFIVRIRELAKQNDFFASHPRKLLFFIAGRYLLSSEAIYRSILKFERISLLPFKYEDVRDALSKQLNMSPTSRRVRQLSADVLYLSGGHPGLMAKIISQYDPKGTYTTNEFTTAYIKDRWTKDLDHSIEEITRGLFQDEPDLLAISKGFCIYRYFSNEIASSILSSLGFNSIQQAHILSKVVSHGLHQHKGPLYGDGLISTLLSLAFFVDSKQNFSEVCIKGKELCVKEMIDDYRHQIWFIEYLYISLLQQSAGYDLQTPEGRSKARESFSTELSDLLIALKNMSDTKKERAETLFFMIEQELKEYRVLTNESDINGEIDNRSTKIDSTQSNFRFLVNYVLGNENYEDEYFEKEFIPLIVDRLQSVLDLKGQL